MQVNVHSQSLLKLLNKGCCSRQEAGAFSQVVSRGLTDPRESVLQDLILAEHKEPVIADSPRTVQERRAPDTANEGGKASKD
ncbi:MAG: hypothetical protein FWE89_00045 [Syntrophaceae bacterium]|nr:hypothetical protein [Syntrophaceae bacterium]